MKIMKLKFAVEGPVMGRLAAFVCLSTLILPSTGWQAAGAASDVARTKLDSWISWVNRAALRKYDLFDNAGHEMDVAKIIPNPYVSGQFIAVYHTPQSDGSFRVNLATSTDLANWTWVRELGGSPPDGYASMAYIKYADDGNGFVIAWEQENTARTQAHVRLLWYSNWANLQAGVASKIYDAPLVFSACANGTPNLYNATSSSCWVGFHYWNNCTVDRQAVASCNWSSWSASQQTVIDNAIMAYGVQGNIGARDGYIGVDGYSFAAIEGQMTPGDWSSWNPYVYDYQTLNADKLTMFTDGGSIGLGGPRCTLAPFHGRNAAICTVFIPSQGVRGTDAAGPLLYYTYTGYAKWGDYDYDLRADAATWRPSEGNFHLSETTGGNVTISLGTNGDIVTPADYDGDGKMDVAVWRPSNGTWYIHQSSDGVTFSVPWGTNGDIPVPADYDGDGKADAAVFRPSNGTWYLSCTSAGAITNQWGASGDIPVPADYDGDGKTDIAFWRPSNGTWYILKSSGGSSTIQWGTNGDIPVPALYDTDAKADVAVFRPSNGTWYITQSTTGGNFSAQWGANGDIPVPADYDGDGRVDAAVWRPSNGTWYITQTSTGGNFSVPWGANGDAPLNLPSAIRQFFYRP